LPIFCNFFITIKKSIQCKLIEAFSIIFYDFFLSFRNLSSFTAAERPERSLALISKLPFLNYLKSIFKPICTRSNNYNIFILCLTNNSVCISSTFFDENKRR